MIQAMQRSKETLIRHDYKQACYRNKSTVIPGRVLPTWFYPKLEAFFNSADTRDMVFSFIALYTENWLPGHVHRRIKRWEEGEWIKSIQVFISDADFEETLEWDFEFIPGPQVLNAPAMFGMPVIEEFGMIADTRSPDKVLWEPDAEAGMAGDRFMIWGETWGRRILFSDFLAGRELDLSKYGPPDVPVVVMERDYLCPIRKRVALHKGCAYGAPVFLNLVSHRKINVQPLGGVLGLLVQDIEREESVQKDALEARHQAMLAFATGKAEFIYHGADESITLNGQHFTKNVPAKILKYLLDAYQKDGRSGFEYRELKRLFEISLGQKNANFEVRFSRWPRS